MQKRASYLGPLEEMKALIRKNHGTVLAGWMHVFDKNGDGSLSLDEFSDALKEVEGFHGDPFAIWRELVSNALKRSASKEGSGTTVGLEEFDADDYALLEGFKEWCNSKFGGPIEMFTRFNSVSGQNEWSFEDFRGICASYGYTGDSKRIFNEALDRGSGKARLQDLMRLEGDRLKREMASNPDLAEVVKEGRKRYIRLKAARRNERRTQKESIILLRRQIRKVAGRNFVRGWRRYLDLNGNMSISRIELFKGCKAIAFKGDVWALWRALDTDDDGLWRLEEVDAHSAALLARFKQWCWEKFGGCVKALETISEYANIRLSKKDVEEALKTCGFHCESPKEYRILHEMFDLDGCGYILPEDVAFLDKWQAQPWLLAEPDYAAAESFKEALKARYPNLLCAWLKALDTDKSNRVCYREFETAWNLIHQNKKIEGAARAWKALDLDNSGYISLSELDAEAHDELYHFKTWAEGLFGSVHRAFQALDEDGSKGLTLAEFKVVAKNLGYDGRIKLLFNSLKPEVRHSTVGKDPKLTFEDLKFLESWNEVDHDDDDDEEEVALHQQLLDEQESHANCGCERCERRHDAWMCSRKAVGKSGKPHGQAPDWAKQLGGDAVAASTLPAVFRVGGCGIPSPPRFRRAKQSLAYCLNDSEFDVLKQIPPLKPGEGSPPKQLALKAPTIRSPYQVYGDVAKAVRHFDQVLDMCMPQRNNGFRQKGSPQKSSGAMQRSKSLPALAST